MRRSLARATVALLVGLAAWSALAGTAHAHATLQATTPGDGSRLEQAPASVSLTFSEPVNAPLGAVQVVDGSGGRVDTGAVTQTGATVSVPLEGGLGEGAYVVTYRVISADAHPIRGALAFTVGDAAAADPATVAASLDADDDRAWEVAGAVARWLAYVGALLAAGGAAHLALVDTRPSARLAEGRLLGAAAVVALLGVAATLPIQAHLATGLGIGSLFRPGVAGDVLGDGIGLSALVVFLGLATITAGLGAARTEVARVVLLVGAGLAVGGFAIAGHTTTTDPRWLATAADVVHLVAAATWFGGLVLLGRSLVGRRAPEDPAEAGRLVAGFSRLATGAIVAVGVAGIVLGWTEVRTLDGLTGTTYGRVLLAKVAVVILIAVAGTYNHLRLVPAVVGAAGRVPDGGGWQRLRRTVRAEALAMAVVLALTAVLVNVTPARAADTGPASTTVALGDGSVNVVVDPATTGANALHLYLLDETGRPADIGAAGVTLELRLPANDLGPLVREPYRVGPGHLQLDGTDFSVAGTWEVTVLARPSRFEQLTATATIRVRP